MLSRGDHVRLEIPECEKWKCRFPTVHGEHYGYDGHSGRIIAFARDGGVWVSLDNTKYIGCPVEWMRLQNGGGLAI